MGIGDYDMPELLNIKTTNPHIKTCAILGDCSFHYRGGSKKHFKNIMKLDVVHTFDINGNPDYKLDLQEPLPIEFKEKYDLILDIGTLYCIFDIPSCLKNMLFMLTSNGTIFHNSNLGYNED